MTGYRLSAEARRAEERYSRSRHMPATRKNVSVTGLASRHDGQNFTHNMVTVADYEDRVTGTSNPVGLTATWACTNLIAGTIASLPLMVYRTEGGVRKAARDHWLWYLLHDSPNYDQTALDFWEFMAAGLELRGSAFADMSNRRSDGTVVSLEPIRPDIVQVRRDRSGALEYEWYDNGRRIVKGARDVLHIRGPMGNALGGASTLSLCAGAFGSAIAAENAARRTFANGLRPSGTLSMEESLTKEQRTELETLLIEKFGGAMNAGRPMVLDRGMSWQAINITPEDAQMLDSRKFSGEEICRIFGVPPAMVGYGDKASNWGTGKEVDVLGFQKFTLRRRLKRIEQAVAKQLLTPRDRAQGIVLEFNIEGLLRADSLARAEFYERALGDTQKPGWMVRNEVRRLENLPPVEGWDDPIPLITNSTEEQG